MGWIIASIGRGFREVTRFEGRDTLAQFWPYALFVMGLEFLISTAITITAMIPMFVEIGQAAGSGIEPDQAQLQAGMAGHLAGFMPYTITLGLIVAALMAAATVRRFHDRDWTGQWVALPIGLRLIGAALSPWAVEWAMSPPGLHTLFNALISLVNLAVFVFLLIVLVQRGKAEPNRFGPAPEPGT